MGRALSFVPAELSAGQLVGTHSVRPFSSVLVRVLQAHLTHQEDYIDHTCTAPLGAAQKPAGRSRASGDPGHGLYAQTTGRLFGQLADAQGAALPGVTVTVSSPALQGTQTQVTDGEGNYRFPSLPPGHYTVKAELASFKTVEQPVDIGLDRTVTLNLKMSLAGVTESVTVQATSPTVDTTSTTTGRQRDARTCSTSFPSARDFYALDDDGAGVTSDMVGPIVYGSSSAENQYIIDGLNTTGVELGDKGKTLNNDFVQEVEVKTGGLPAEYGRMTGGVVNVLTKSGGNQLSGSIFGFGEGGPLQANNSTARRTAADDHADRRHRASGGRGGLAGRIHPQGSPRYFGAYNRVNERDDTTLIRTIASPGAPEIGSVIPLTINRDLYAVKLTGKVGSGHTFNFNVNGDPSKRERQRVHDFRTAEHVRRRAEDRRHRPGRQVQRRVRQPVPRPGHGRPP